MVFDKRWTINIPLSNKFTKLKRSHVTHTNKLNYNFHFYRDNEKKIELCLKIFNTPLKNIHRLDLEHSVQENSVKYLQKHGLVGLVWPSLRLLSTNLESGEKHLKAAMTWKPQFQTASGSSNMWNPTAIMNSPPRHRLRRKQNKYLFRWTDQWGKTNVY